VTLQKTLFVWAATLATTCVALPVAHSAETVWAAALEPGEKVRVDGAVDEAAWGRAQVIDAFVGIYPSEGFVPRGTTRVRVLTDSTHI